MVLVLAMRRVKGISALSKKHCNCVLLGGMPALSYYLFLFMQKQAATSHSNSILENNIPALVHKNITCIKDRLATYFLARSQS